MDTPVTVIVDAVLVALELLGASANPVAGSTPARGVTGGGALFGKNSGTPGFAIEGCLD